MPLVFKPCFHATDGDCNCCVAVCPGDAIRFIVTRGGTRLAEIIGARCGGCGRCIAVCPADAIVDRPSLGLARVA